MTNFNSKQSDALTVDPNKVKPAEPMHDNSQGVLERAGGNLATPDDVAAMAPQALDNDTNRVLRTTILGDGTVKHQSESPMQGSTADRPLGTSAGANIRSLEGDPQTVHSMTEDSIITLHGGGEVRLLDAIEAGIVKLTENGNLLPGDDAPPAAKAEKEQEVHEDLKAVALNDEGEAAVDAINASVQPTTQLEAIGEMAKDGEISERLINQASSEAGIEPAEMHSRLASVQTAMFTQASDRVSKFGIDPAALWEHANEHMREELGKAVHAQLTKRTLHDYDALAKSYVENLDTIDPEAILSADFGGQGRAHRDAETGKIIITDSKGRTYSWRSGLAAGIISLSRG